MRGVIIGSGNVARCYGYRLIRGGHAITQVYSPIFEHARLRASDWGAQALVSWNQVDPTADFYLLAVKDDAISEVCTHLGAIQGIVIHTSGSVPLSVLEIAGFEAGVIYPLQSIHAGTDDEVMIPVLLEASNPHAMSVVRQLAGSISTIMFDMPSDRRLCVHLAAVISNNFMTHLLRLWRHYCAQAGINVELFAPLLDQTLKLALDSGSNLLQTGPAVRNDGETISKHLTLLEDHPELHTLYQFMTESIMRTHSLEPAQPK